MKKNTGNNAFYTLVLFASLTMIVSCKDVPKHTDGDKIIVYLQLSAKIVNPEPQNYALKNKMEIEYLPVKNVEDKQEWQSVNALMYNGYVKWTLYASEPVKIKYGFGTLPIVNPGDSIVVHYNGEEFQFEGRGADKLTCWNKMQHVGRGTTLPTVSNNYLKSLNDYNNWMKYLNNNIAEQDMLLETYKDKIDPFAYEYLKTNAVARVESDRIQVFRSLRTYSKKDSNAHITLVDLNAIWDSTQYHYLNLWQQTVDNYYSNTFSIREFTKEEVWRKFSFDPNCESLKTKGQRNYLYYTHAKEKYKGMLRERLLAEILKDQTRSGFKDPITQIMLKDYYNQPGFPEYKKQVKEIEEKVAKVLAKK